MGRPRDLPQPVRHHPAHQGPTPVGCSPGPAYEGYGVTHFDRDRRLGIITGSRSGGADHQQRSTSANGNSNEVIENSSGTPGPKYNNADYNAAKTRLAASIPRAKRFTDYNTSTPGPGTYDQEHPTTTTAAAASNSQHVSSTIGTLPRSRRQPLANPNLFPSAAEYSPNVSLTKSNHGSSSFPYASVKQRNARSVAKCETSDASFAGPDEFNAAEKWTRPSSVRASIGHGPRFAREIRAGSGEVGPGQYDVTARTTVVGRSAPSIGFSMGTRKYKNFMTFQEMDRDIAATGGGTAHQILPSTLSSKGVKIAPREVVIQNNNDRQKQSGSTNLAGTPGLHHPDVTLARPTRKSVSIGKAPRFGNDIRPASANVTSDPTLPSTLNTSRGARIGTGKRFTLTEQQRECFAHPSPAEYTPTLPKRPESAARSMLHRNERIGQLLRDSQSTPGPKYDIVDMNLTKDQLSKQASFPKSDRGLSGKIEKDFTSPGVGAYDTDVDPRKKGGRSAILYLGA